MDFSMRDQVILTETNLHPLPRTIGRPAPKVVAIQTSNATATQKQASVDLDAVGERAKQAGYAKGLELGKKEGFEAGYQQGLVAAQKEEDARVTKELNAEFKKVNQFMRQLSETVDQRIAHLEVEALELAFSSLCKIIGDAESFRSIAVETIKHAVSQLTGRGLVTARVHPDDILWLSQVTNATDPQFNSRINGKITWIPDTDIELGGCILETSNGSIDARLETQLEQLKELISTLRKASI